MSKDTIITNTKRTFSRAGLKLKKHSPEILVIVGIAGTVTAAVMACKATLKAEAVIEEAKDGEHTVEQAKAINENYAQNDSKKELRAVYIRAGIKLIRLYAPALTVWAVSACGILTSHGILRKRNTALAATYAAADKSLKELEARITERFGKEICQELKYNLKEAEITKKETDESGVEKEITEKITVADSNLCSQYARIFDRYSSHLWDSNPDTRAYLLNAQQNLANDMLRTKGHIFLNEVYDLLDLERTKEGQIVGWVYDPKNAITDSYVEFEIIDNIYSEDDGSENGYNEGMLIDFNVDGNILDLI